VGQTLKPAAYFFFAGLVLRAVGVTVATVFFGASSTFLTGVTLATSLVAATGAVCFFTFAILNTSYYGPTIRLLILLLLLISFFWK